EREDEAKSLAITVAPPAAVRPGVYQLKAAVLGGAGQRSDGALVLIDYPHIRPRAVVHTSTAELRAVRISLPALTRVGYVRGASDRVPGVRDRARPRREQRATVGLRPRGRPRDRPVPAIPVCEWRLRAISPLDRAHARPRDRRDRGRDGAGRREPRVPRAERNRARRLAGLGAGARTVFRARLGSRVYAPAGDARPRRAAAPGCGPGGRGRQGHVRVHGAELFPAAAGGC